MKKSILLFFGISPFIIGYLINNAMMKLNLHGALLIFISMLFFIYWFFIGIVSSNYTKTAWQSFWLGNGFAVISIILIVQELVLGRYLPSLIGTMPQMFYLAPLAFTSWLLRTLLFFISTHYFWPVSILAFILMTIVYCLGYFMGSQRG